MGRRRPWRRTRRRRLPWRRSSDRRRRPARRRARSWATSGPSRSAERVRLVSGGDDDGQRRTSPTQGRQPARRPQQQPAERPPGCEQAHAARPMFSRQIRDFASQRRSVGTPVGRGHLALGPLLRWTRDSFNHLFFSDDPHDIARAKAICSRCGVREPCLTGAHRARRGLGCVGRRDLRRRSDRRRQAAPRPAAGAPAPAARRRRSARRGVVHSRRTLEVRRAPLRSGSGELGRRLHGAEHSANPLDCPRLHRGCLTFAPRAGAAATHPSQPERSEHSDDRTTYLRSSDRQRCRPPRSPVRSHARSDGRERLRVGIATLEACGTTATHGFAANRSTRHLGRVFDLASRDSA